MTCTTGAPIRRAKTIATWRAWRCCLLVYRRRSRRNDQSLVRVQHGRSGHLRACDSAGEAELMIAGGVEGMSRAPFVMPKADSAFSRSNSVFDTTLGWRFVNSQMKAQYGIDSMPETAENVAHDYGVARADQDAFALRSQQRYSAARARGF